MSTDGRFDTLSKKEIARNEKERKKLQKNLEGIRGMSRLPDAVFVVDTKKEKIAVDEARKLKIPVIGIVDTNCDPDEVDFVIPGNDDALRAIRLFASRIAETVIQGRDMKQSIDAETAREAAEEAAASDTDARGRGRSAAPAKRSRHQRSARLHRLAASSHGTTGTGAPLTRRDASGLESRRLALAQGRRFAATAKFAVRRRSDGDADNYRGHGEEAARPDRCRDDGMQSGTHRGERRLRGSEHDPAQARARQRGEEGRPRRPAKESSATGSPRPSERASWSK